MSCGFHLIWAVILTEKDTLKERKMTKKDVCVFALVCFCLTLFSVNLEGQEIKIKQEDGITVVNNPLNPVKSLDSSFDMVLKEDLIIGTNEKNTDYYFEVISDIKADENGNIYVVDSSANSVKVFNSKGKYLKDIGRQGQGPGEFMAPMGMAIVKDKISVYSMGRLSFFTLDGDFIQHNKVMFGRLMCFDSEGNIITKVPGPPGNVFKEFLRKFNPEGKLILEVAEIVIAPPPSPNEKRKAFPENVLFTVRQNDSIVWTNRSQYEVNVVGKDGQAFLKIKKENNPVKLTEKHKQSFLAYYGAAEDHYTFPQNLPPIRYICADNKNRIFVCTYESTGEDTYIYDIFDEQGRYVERVAIKGLPLFWKKRYLYCRGEDENNFHKVIRYRIET